MSVFSSRGKILVRMPMMGYGSGKVDLDGIEAFKKGIVKVGPKLKSELRTVALPFVKDVVPEAKRLASVRQQPAAAKSIQPQLFKGLPSLRAGGSKKLSMTDTDGSKHKVAAGLIFAGAEFGSAGKKNAGHMTRHKDFYKRSFVASHKNGSTRQFPSRSPKLGRGNAGWFFYPAIRNKVDAKTVLPIYFNKINAIMRKYI